MTKVEKLKSEIKKTKAKLIKKWKTKGAYENFGEKEQRTLNDKYGSYDNTPEAKEIQKTLDELFNWSINYEGGE